MPAAEKWWVFFILKKEPTQNQSYRSKDSHLVI
jgi:hypothetical protein